MGHRAFLDNCFDFIGELSRFRTIGQASISSSPAPMSSTALVIPGISPMLASVTASSSKSEISRSALPRALSRRMEWCSRRASST